MSNHYVIALLATYSYDYWSEINEADEELRVPDEGPDEHSYAMIGALSSEPSRSELVELCSQVRSALDNSDGKSDIIAVNTLAEVAWLAFKAEYGIKEQRTTGSLDADGYITLTEFGSKRPVHYEPGWIEPAAI